MSKEPKATMEITVYGSAISYYTGKLEAYLRYKNIPYRFVSLSPKIGSRLQKETGAGQIPAVELPEGRFMTDTTPMIDWFETQYPQPSIIPLEPVQAFASRLLEDYAEEWLWRPAMHYRWNYRADAHLISRRIADEMLVGVPLPGWFKRLFFRIRQREFYVKRDGVNKETWSHVESIYLNTLDRLTDILKDRPYLLGGSPTLADFGFFASMFRHFSQDPTAAEIMRQRAPAVFEWQARLWNAKAMDEAGELVSGVPEDLGPFLDDIGQAYLPYLCANAEAWAAGQTRYDTKIQGVQYRRLPVSQYRVWCLERLRAHFEALDDEARTAARTLLEKHGCWEPLWRIEHLESRHDPDGQVPFRGRRVHYEGR